MTSTLSGSITVGNDFSSTEVPVAVTKMSIARVSFNHRYPEGGGYVRNSICDMVVDILDANVILQIKGEGDRYLKKGDTVGIQRGKNYRWILAADITKENEKIELRITSSPAWTKKQQHHVKR
jgi:hypothetical protein